MKLILYFLIHRKKLIMIDLVLLSECEDLDEVDSIAKNSIFLISLNNSSEDDLVEDDDDKKRKMIHEKI